MSTRTSRPMSRAVIMVFAAVATGTAFFVAAGSAHAFSHMPVVTPGVVVRPTITPRMPQVFTTMRKAGGDPQFSGKPFLRFKFDTP
jgi:hypothetical protein